MLAALLAVSPAVAQRPAPVPLDPSRLTVVRPDAYRPIDAAGRAIGPWRPMPLSSVVREAPIWTAAWDSTGTRLSDFAAFANPYGATAGPHVLPPNTYKSFMQANDLVLAPGHARAIASRVRVGLLWNPAGTGIPSGSLDLVVRVAATETNDADPMAEGPAYTGALSGYEFLRRNQASGPIVLDADLSGQGQGLPLPDGQGGLWVVFGSADAAGSFVPLGPGAAAQPILSNMASPGEPQFPGSNPASSTEYMWSDENSAGLSSSINRPDYAFQDFTNNASAFWAEQFSYDFTLENKGLLQGAAGLFVDGAMPTLRGTVAWSGIDAGAPTPRRGTFTLKNDATGAVLGVYTTLLGADGSFVLPDPIPAGGRVRVLLKADIWLTESTVVTTSGSGASGFSIAMERNADIDRDDTVTVFDYDKLSQYFDAAEGESGWTTPDADGIAPRDADLDRDGAVTVFDYDILSTWFDAVGDE